MKIDANMLKSFLLNISIGLSLLVLFSQPTFGDKKPKKMDYEAGFYYTVKKGDTLWDISQRFDDTPWVWPELWKENEQLPNPHWIYPGERIRLYRKKGKHRIQHQKATTSQTKNISSPSTIEPEPESEPQVNFHYGRMDQVGFIRTPSVQPSGIIFNVLDNKELISTGDILYIQRPKSGKTNGFSPGARYTVYRTLKPTKKRHSEKKVGIQHYLLGIVEVSQNESQYAIAKVIEAFRAIEPGDLLMEYETRPAEIIVTESTPDLQGSIINTEDHNNLIGSNVTAFIDKGEIDNVRVGQQYAIYYQETKKGVDGQPVPLAPVDVGSLLVLHTEKTTSTVFITDAYSRIVPGYKIRTP